MKASATLIRDVIRAADGEIVGRIRLQKVLYLLDVKGLDIVDASFHYHHYGPYSRVLDEALDRAKALLGVSEEIRHRKADGAPFSVFRATSGGGGNSRLGSIDSDSLKKLLSTMKEKTSTVLELAATVHWLTQVERVSDWKAEIVRRKGAKTEDGRLEEALDLLKKLTLPVPA